MQTSFTDRFGGVAFSEDQAVAKQILDVGQRTYFVRAGIDGRLFEATDDRACLTRTDKERGGLRYTLRRCSEATYQRYVEYLITRNKANLRAAERTFNDECK